jgi:hypothetical protein
MPESARNTALTDLYRRHWPALKEICLRDERLSMPYLAWVHPDYEQARTRLVIVGKETNGWGDRECVLRAEPEDAVRLLMHTYRGFELGTHYPGKRSFWTPVHELYRLLNPNGPALGFVALNASKMDLRGAIPGEEVRSALTQTRLLPDEIRILQPHVVVFHTGPKYERWLDGWFPGLARAGDVWLARLTADGLPRLTFRTYHPRYLNYCSQRQAIYGRIVAEVASAT